MKKRVDVYVIGVLCLALCSLFQVHDVKTVVEVAETDLVGGTDVVLDQSSGSAPAFDAEAIAYQEEQARIAAEAEEQARIAAEEAAAEEADKLAKEAAAAEEIEEEDEEHHHSEGEEGEEDADSESDDEGAEPFEEEEIEIVGSTFDLGLISIFDGEGGDLYRLLSAGKQGFNAISVGGAITTYEGKLKSFYDLVSNQNSSAQSTVNAIKELESMYNTTLVNVVGDKLSFLVGQVLKANNADYQVAISSVNGTYQKNKGSLGLSINDESLSQEHAAYSYMILDCLIEELDNQAVTDDFFEIVLNGVVAVSGMITLSLQSTF